LIPALQAKGVDVSTVKHAHHAFDVDVPGKDSYEHRRAGAREVLVSSANRWVLMHELRGDDELTLEERLGKVSPVDLVLVEGFKRHAHPKLEVYRAAVDKPMLWPDDPNIVAVASDAPVPGLDRPLLDLDDVDAIATFILERTGLRVYGQGQALAQLSDDCFAFDGPLMRVDDALAILQSRVACLAEEETAPLDRAVGRYLAADLAATRSLHAEADGPGDVLAEVEDHNALAPLLNADRPDLLGDSDRHAGEGFQSRPAEAEPPRPWPYRLAAAIARPVVA